MDISVVLPGLVRHCLDFITAAKVKLAADIAFYLGCAQPHTLKVEAWAWSTRPYVLISDQYGNQVQHTELVAAGWTSQVVPDSESNCAENTNVREKALQEALGSRPGSIWLRNGAGGQLQPHGRAGYSSLLYITYGPMLPGWRCAQSAMELWVGQPLKPLKKQAQGGALVVK